MYNRRALYDDVLVEERAPISPLAMSDRLITLAREAERAGYTATAHDLIDLACSVFDETLRLLH